LLASDYHDISLNSNDISFINDFSLDVKSALKGCNKLQRSKLRNLFDFGTECDFCLPSAANRRLSL